MTKPEMTERRAGDRRKVFSEQTCEMNSPYGAMKVEQNECSLVIRNGAQGAVGGTIRNKVLVRFFDLPMAVISVPQHWITLHSKK